MKELLSDAALACPGWLQFQTSGIIVGAILGIYLGFVLGTINAERSNKKTP